MKRIKSESEKRLVIEGLVNDKKAYFLLDTGACIGLIDVYKKREYGLLEGRRYAGNLVGIGGEMRGIHHCDTFVDFEGRKIPQFLLADISSVVESIQRETGIEILGIISLPQMAMIGLNIDVNSHEIWLE